MNDFLSKDDYEEPRCLLNMHPKVTPISVGRMIEKLDSYLNQNDYDAAERHLKYWLTEADSILGQNFTHNAFSSGMSMIWAAV